MSGSPTRSSQGPPGTRRAALCVAALAVFGATALGTAALGAVAAGCAASTATPLPFEAPGLPPTPDAERLRAALVADAGAGAGAVGVTTSDAFFAGALRAAGLTPPVEGRFTFPAPGAAGPVVAGFIPGRRAPLRDTLVVAVAVGRVGRAALLEAACLLAARATFTATPQRSLLVAFPTTAPAGAEAAGAEAADAALARVLALPLWDAAAVRHVVLVGGGADTTAARAAAQERGLHFTVIGVTPAAAAADDDVEAARGGALAAYAALLDAARRPPPPIVTVLPAPDSLLPPPAPGRRTPGL